MPDPDLSDAERAIHRQVRVMPISVSIALVVAWLLIKMRGGVMAVNPFGDVDWAELTVVLVFVIAPFAWSQFLFWLFEQQQLQRIESMLQRLPSAILSRSVLAVTAALSLLWWSGPTILSGGWAGWLVAILFAVIAPLPICLMAPCYPVVYGALTNTFVVLSIEAWNFVNGQEAWSDFWQEQVQSFLIVWLVAMSISLVSSLPIYVQRRKWQR